MKYLTIVIFLFSSVYALGQQNHNNFLVLEADSTWTKEVIKFPLGFAPEIDFEGYEDLRFADGWKKMDQPDFWTYVFVWNVKLKQALSKNELETYLKLYFDGIMTAVNKKKDFKIPSTLVTLAKVDTSNVDNIYRGTIKMHDSFHTEEMMTLHVFISQERCKTSDKVIPFFRLSHNHLIIIFGANYLQ